MSRGWAALAVLLAALGPADVAAGGPGTVGQRLPEPPTLVWRRQLVREGLSRDVIESQATPVVDEGHGQVVCGTGEREVLSLDVRDTRVRWRFGYVAPFESAAGLFCRRPACLLGRADTVAIGAKDGALLAIDAHSGQLAWRAALDAEVRAQPLAADEALLVTTSRNQLLSLEAATGKVRWRFERPAPVGMTVLGHAGPLCAHGVAYASFSDGFAVAAQAADGAVLWQRPLSLGRGRFRDADATPVALGPYIAFASLTDGIAALQPQSGELAWQQPLPEVSQMATSWTPKGHVLLFAGTADGQVVALAGGSGRAVWTNKVPQPDAVRAITAVTDVLYVLSASGNLRILSQRDGRCLASMSLGGRPGGQLAAAEEHAAHLTSQGALLLWRFAPLAASARPPAP